MSSISLQQLIQALAERHICLDALDGQLSVNAPKGALTAELVKALKQHKPALIDFLAAQKVVSNKPVHIIPDKQNIHQPFPFSDLQVAFYMAGNAYMEYHVQPHYYNEVNYRNFDITRYQQAINLVFERHRGDAVLITDDGQLQVLNPLPSVNCQIHNFTTCAPEEREQGLLAIRQRMMRQELPLDQWPWIVFEISVWNESGEQHTRIHSNVNNFYSDGFGVSILHKEIEQFYHNPALTLPPLELSYRDAVLGLRELSESPEGLEAKEYWLSRLPDLPAPPALPQRVNVNRKCRSRLQRRENILPATLWDAIKKQAASYGLTPSSVIITAYAELLSSWSGSQHFILSNMVTRRLPIHPQIKEIIGNFASLYPLEIDLRGDLSFIDKVRRIQQQILIDSGKRQWGGMQVMQAFNQLKGEFSRVPCPFVVGSALFMEDFQKPDFSCLETAQTLFDHQFWELGTGEYYYVWDLLEEFFPEGMIASMWVSFEHLLQRLGESSSIWQERVLTIAPAAFPQNENHEMPVSHSLLHQGLAVNVTSIPDAVFVSTVTGDYSYDDIDRYSERIAELLSMQTHTLMTNNLVAIVMDRSESLLAAVIAVLKAGGAYVPIEPSLPCERIQYLLTNTHAQIVLADAVHTQKIARVCSEKIALINIDTLDCDLHNEKPAINSPTINSQAIDTQCTDLAYVIYTSGSTGKPKGVMIDHRAALNTVKDINRRFNINQYDVVLGVSSFSFDLSVYDIFGVLEAGARLVYPDPAAACNPAHWLALLNEKNVTVWNSAPPLMALLLETGLRQNVSLPDLRLVMLSGDWIPLDLHHQLQQLAPNAQLISLGGATEASIWSIYHPVKQIEPHWISIPYGKPLANQGWQIRDAIGRQVPLWTVGELWITGMGLARGYWQDAEKTKSRFIIDTATGERCYRTGDWGRYLPDGTIEFMGRMDDQVKIQGYRIELGEIEATLMRNHLVKQAVVLVENIDKDIDNNGDKGRAKDRDKNTDKKDKRLVAFVVLKNTTISTLGKAEKKCLLQNSIITFSEYLKKSLPSYMVPHAWALLAEIPLTRNGKIDRKALLAVDHNDRGESNQGKSDQGKSDQEKTCRKDGSQRASIQQVLPNTINQQPRNAIEERLLTIWLRILNRESLSIYDDFFDLGGRSFDAVRCLALIKEQLGNTLSLGDIWEYRTIVRLAEYIGHNKDNSSPLIMLNDIRGKQPCFMIHPGGGQVVAYYPLAKYLHGPCLGLCALERDVDRDDMHSIEAIASRYTTLIRRQQKRGPYQLVGWSSGSYIAFEIAFQLEQLGELVNKLVIIDAPAPMQHLTISPMDMLKGFFEDLGLGLPISRIDALVVSGQDEKSQFTRICDDFNQTPTIHLSVDQLYPMFRVFSACVNASRNYDPLGICDRLVSQRVAQRVPKKVNASIVVIRAQEGVVTEFASHPYQEQLDWGWQYLTHTHIEATSILGTHHTILQEPQVNIVADYINKHSHTNKHGHRNTYNRKQESEVMC